ncbi:dockerin type I repeat-containing protein [Ruminococcus flavefaciens]|uniref:Dockerin domain-containing protein n=1 Tax=Ruminococcus flavefaciens TaxID=1265 RepID=A0A1M7GNW5_RUMFL|nr:dockerin type I repeat-containing protein [Ruminococcus flavefaciens]SHM17855.1 hypothetical protein SAMN04487860_101407 [Ruminococcus flavefaciens]
MKLKKLTAAFTAATAAVIPFYSGNSSLLSLSNVSAEEQASVSPDWIPTSFEEALEFRNTYGATHIGSANDSDIVCLVFQEKAPDTKKYEIVNTDALPTTYYHKVFKDEETNTAYDVYAFKKAVTGVPDFDIKLLCDKEVQQVYHFTSSGTQIIENDIYSWLPDCITEYEAYIKENGRVSARDDLVVFGLEYAAGTRYKWTEADKSYTSNLKHYDTVDCSFETAELLDGGSIHRLEVYKAVKDGNAKITYNFGIIPDEGESPAEQTLIADCTVTDNAQKVTLDESYIQDAIFKKASYSLYGTDLTVSSYDIYDKFAESKSAVINSQDELKKFLSTYLKEAAIKNFISVYDESFFKDNVLMLNTYLDPYRGRVFKHGLKGVQYKDGKLVIGYTSIVSANLMRTSYFDILQLIVPRSEYKKSEVVWQNEEKLEYDLKRISIIDEDTGEYIEIPYGTALDLFGNDMKYIEGSNPYFKEVLTDDGHDIELNEKYLPYGYELSKTSPKEIKEYGNNNADIVFRVKKKGPVYVKFAIDRVSTLTSNIFKNVPQQGFKPVVAESEEELDKALSACFTDEFKKKYFYEYDYEFFKKNVLILNFMVESTSPRTIGFGDVEFSKDTISVYYTMPSTDFGVCNTDYLCIMQVAVPKSGYEGQKAEWKCMGDANGDGEFGIADLVNMQKWLASSPDAKLSDLKAVDYCNDGEIDIFDLVAMRKKLIEVHQLDAPVTYGIEAQYVRTDGYISGAKYPQTKLITSAEELKSYIEANKDKYNMKSEEFNDAVEKYSSKWFDSNKLMIVVLEEGSGSVRHGVTEVTNKSVTINRTVPQVGTADMAEWHIFIEYPGTANISDKFSVKFYNTLLD